MKKFMFSAVALVAFSFAGMANNSVEKVEKEINVEETVILVYGCDTIWSDVFAMEFNGNNLEHAINRANAFAQACEALQ